jgi:HAE1 family hydrophobic/amphiphilic exporter-1
MSLSELSIKRGITFTMVYLIVIGFGIYGLGSLKLDLYPNITFPVIAVYSQYQGVGSEDIENVLTRPLEKAIVSVENIKRITSRSAAGISLIICEFDWDADMNQAEIDVGKKIDLIRDYLPQGATKPVTFAFDPSMQPILYFALSSDRLGSAELRSIAEEQIEPWLERIKGVAAAGTSGGISREIKVLIDPHKIAAQGISINQIVQTLRTENLQVPGGIIDDEYREFNVRTYGEYTDVNQIANTVIGYKAGQPVYLKNVAQVIDGFKDQTDVVRNNGKAALMMYIQKQSDANTVQTAEAVVKELPVIAARIGQNIKFDIIWDNSQFITRSVSNLVGTAIQAFFLSFLVLFLFLRRFRTSLIVAISIPVSVIATFFIMNQAGLTLNIISMAGLALAIGMLVDNSIVVMENIFRHKESGESIRIAAKEGTDEVIMAITASTLTTLAIFVPILFVPGLAGVLFHDMIITIVFSLTMSLIVAMTLIPLMASRWLAYDKPKKNKWWLKFDRVIGNMLNKMESYYVRLLDYFLGHKKLFLMGVIGLTIATAFVFRKVGGEFISTTDQSMIEFSIKRETGASLTTTDQTFRVIEAIVEKEVPEALNINVSFGTGTGMAAIFGSSGSNAGQVRITLPDVKERERTSLEIEAQLRKHLEKIPGIEVSFERGMGMFGSGSDIDVKIFGYDRQIAQYLGDDIAAKIKQVAGVAEVTKSYSLPKPEYQVRLDRDRIAALGLSVYQVASTIETCVKGTIATQYREGGREYDVVVQLDENYRQGKSDLENIYLTTMSGIQVPLKNVAAIIPGEASETIVREDQERMITISCKISGRDLQSVTRDITQILQKTPFPTNFRWEIGGQAEEQAESFMYLGIAILAAILLVYMVMASQFESLLDPFIIIFTVPLAIMGAIWMLFITGTTMSVTALVGMVLLVGIVVNNGIVLIDYINQLREKHGYDLWVAILVGGKRRMRPVLMTALTTIISMVPLALKLGSGAEIWAPLARSVIGGLTLSTFLTLILIPIIYLFFEQIALKRAMKKHKIEMKPIGRPAGFDLSFIQ